MKKVSGNLKILLAWKKLITCSSMVRLFFLTYYVLEHRTVKMIIMSDVRAIINEKVLAMPLKMNIK